MKYVIKTIDGNYQRRPCIFSKAYYFEEGWGTKDLNEADLYDSKETAENCMIGGKFCKEGGAKIIEIELKEKQ